MVRSYNLANCGKVLLLSLLWIGPIAELIVVRSYSRANCGKVL